MPSALSLSGVAVDHLTVGPARGTARVIDGVVQFTQDAGFVDPAAPGADAPVSALLLPGLVNLHEHLRAFLPTGRRHEGAPLAEVITAAARTQAVAGAADYRALTALASARQIRAGATSVIDHVYPLHRAGLVEAVVAGHQQVGLRGSVALGIMTRGDAQVCTSVDDVVALAERYADSLLPAEQVYLAPVSLRQATAADYAAAVRAADRLSLRLYTHIAETRDEVEQCVAEHGVRPVELLDRLGFLRPGTVLVHGIELDDHEIELIARSGTAVVYCPSNHLKLAKGTARVVDLVRAGVLVGLGVDGMESLFHEMRQAVHIQGQAHRDPAALSSTDAFAMATTVGARVLDLPGVVGHLHGGSDLVRLDVSGATSSPVADPVWSVVHRGSPGQVTHVVVDGQLVLADGRLTRADEHELVERACAVTRGLARQNPLDSTRTPAPQPIASPNAVPSS